VNGDAGVECAVPIDNLPNQAVAAVNRGDRVAGTALGEQVLAVDGVNAEAEELLAAPADPGQIRRLTILFADLVPTLTSDPLLSDSAPVTTATGGPADAAPATGTVKADVSPPVTSTDTPTRTEQVTPTGTETAEADEASTGPTAVNAPEPSASASTSEPAKPAGRPATPRPVVRGSLGVGEQLRDLPHRGNGGRPTTQTAAACDGAATAGSSSVASSSVASSSTGSSSSGGGSSGGDAGDS
jgi:hypothetical protein